MINIIIGENSSGKTMYLQNIIDNTRKSEIASNIEDIAKKEASIKRSSVY